MKAEKEKENTPETVESHKEARKEKVGFWSNCRIVTLRIESPVSHTTIYSVHP